MAAARLKKRFGQHHLRSGSLCRPLVDFLAPLDGPVVEIGPGGGVLTRVLAEAGGRVFAWELDPEWAFTLRGRADRRPAALVVGDALDLDWGRLPAGTPVAGNLPYAVATPLIDRLLGHPRTVSRAAFMVQLEVAQRLAAEPGTPAYGALSVLTQARAEVRMLGRVARGSFHPPPKVDGAFVGLRPRPLPAAADWGRFADTVWSAFGQRRKTVRNALASAWGRLEAERALEAAGLDPSARAEALSLDQFLALDRARGGR